MYLSQVNVVLDTVSLVYEIIKQREFINLYSSQKQRLQGHVATAEIMETSGLSTPIDTYRASLGLQDVQQQLNVAREKYLASLERLKNLLAYPPDESLEIIAPLTFTPTSIVENKATAIALEHRIELEQSKADLDEAARKSRVAEKGLLPDVELVASYHNNAFSDDFSDFSSDSDEFWSVGIRSSTDFSRTREKAAFQQSLLEVRKKKLQYQGRKDEILSDVKKQLDALHKGEQRIHIRQEQIMQATGKMRLAEIKFSHGMGNNFDLIESETELQRAETNLLTEKCNYIVGQYRLRAALGTLLAR
jgi:outer membrane protein TolC